MYEKMTSNIEEVRARSGRIISVGDFGDDNLRNVSDITPVHRTQDELLRHTLDSSVALCLSCCRGRNCDVDQPRNLAKSVTVAPHLAARKSAFNSCYTFPARSLNVALRWE